METEGWRRMAELADECTLPSLSRPRDEYTNDYTSDYQLYIKMSPGKISALVDSIEKFDDRLGGGRVNVEFASSLLLLMYEMRPDSPWAKYVGFSEHLPKLRKAFKDAFGFDLMKKFPGADVHRSLAKDMFVCCMDKLHRKLTKESWKREPAALYCFRILVHVWTKNHKIKCPLPFIFPGIFVQIDDYDDNNKVEGLKCGQAILKNVTGINSDKTGYITVIYQSLFKYISYKETPILCETMKCMMMLLEFLVTDKYNTRWSQVDDVFGTLLTNLPMESDWDRKRIHWDYLIKIIEIHGHVSIRWKKKILLAVAEALDMCISETSEVSDTSLYLTCLENWIKSGWAVWKYETDKNIILSLFKILYVKKGVTLNSEKYCLIVLLKLCSAEERQELLSEEYVNISYFDKEFKELWFDIKKTVK